MSRDLAVRSELEREPGALETTAAQGYASAEAFLEALPDTLPEQCPDCRGSLRAAAMFTDEDDEGGVVRLVCFGDHRGLAATYVYESATGGLYLDRETAIE